MIDYKSVLAKHGLSRTEYRIKLLKFFYTSRASLSIEDVLKNFYNSINKVTVYRALESFEKKGLIHQVPDCNNLKRYSLCREDECSVNIHSHNHGHFICHSCSQTFCLDDVKYPELACVEGFYIKELKLTLEGYCKDCYVP